MKISLFIRSMVAVFALSALAGGQVSPSGAGTACPVELRELQASGLRVHLRNTAGKPIVGVVFNLAFSDATERWKWLHWNYDLTRPLQEFGWNKRIKDGEDKKLSWGYDLQHEHGGGVALVLTSILFADGSRWEDGVDSATCKEIWYNGHKNGFTRPVDLPRRE